MGASFAGKIPFGTKDDLRFTVSAGDGIGRYLALNTVNDVQVTPEAELETISAYAGFIAWRHVWTGTWRSTLAVSTFSADHDTDLVGFAVTKAVQSASVNLLYSPVKPLTFGVEYRHATREEESGAKGDLDRLQFSVKYLFDWTR